jgi:hypothetical protein
MDALTQHLGNGTVGPFRSAIGFWMVSTRHVELGVHQVVQPFPERAGE